MCLGTDVTVCDMDMLLCVICMCYSETDKINVPQVV